MWCLQQHHLSCHSAIFNLTVVLLLYLTKLWLIWKCSPKINLAFFIYCFFSFKKKIAKVLTDKNKVFLTYGKLKVAFKNNTNCMCEVSSMQTQFIKWVRPQAIAKMLPNQPSGAKPKARAKESIGRHCPIIKWLRGVSVGLIRRQNPRLLIIQER